MKLFCRHCQAVFSPEELLENCTQSWPDQHWVYFVCPECHKGMNLEVKNEFVFVGFLDGGPGSSFIYERGYTIEGLRVEREGNDLTIHYGSHTRRIPSK
ncbi:hypothetical protein SCOR_14470 [Sulfidibacter corallicola]|uniref:Uncharacterized protein n=1 Tax=Sulfidibacter corallicola TaxID=2818388 RepID=A0A8A4TZH5_SULCO|nr:hypothetical protein [Sulfidibacter corallicola]QTD54332.1 hypothetical protein J3U87_17950 [Sulfidibacter corallicola]